MNVEHSGIAIEYKESDNRWYFELRGRSRNAESLAKAKEAIDKEPAEKRKQTFPRFDAYRNGYSQGWQIVSITSVADAGYRHGTYFWIQNQKKEREKVSADDLFPVNEHNDKIMAVLKEFEKQIAALKKQKEAQQAKLQCATVPKEIA